VTGLYPYTRLLALELIDRGIATSVAEVEQRLSNGYSKLSDPDLRRGIRVYLRSMERLGAVSNADGRLTLTELGRALVKKETPQAVHAAIDEHEARWALSPSRGASAR